MTHEELKKILREQPGKAFVQDMTWRLYSWATKIPVEYYNYRVFEELTIRYNTDEKTRLGLQKTKHYRFDAVLFVQPGLRALNQRQCYTVGIELKGEKEDLIRDAKMGNYIGWTDFFFIGVPDNLIAEALERTKENDYMGVVNVEFGMIVKLPKRINVSEANRNLLYEQVIYNTVFNEVETVYFTCDDIDVIHPKLTEFPQPLYNISEVSNIDTLNKQGNKQGGDIPPQLHEGLSEEEKAARKAAVMARMEFRRQRAIEVAEQGAELPESTRLILSTLPDQTQQAYHIIRQKPMINAHGLERELGVAEATAKRCAVALKDAGLICREGSKKTGGYMIVEKNSNKIASRCRECAIYKAFEAKKKGGNP